ncbi:unnamed protein product [Allacma fusca]|uniref:USP domain-containing protein n=1 Tax=Allacma fusca TaxID=39272 RepID=A0A8J2L8R5_9HEXA|nr:unnamed protein product [Allacma fusca]
MTRKYGPNNNNSRNRQGQEDEGEGKGLMRKRPAGLVNLGNTCFMNAALQCLSRTPNLLERLEMLTKEPTITFCGSALSYNNESQGKNEEVLKFTLMVPPESVIRKMVALLHQMTEGSGATVNPRNVHYLMTRNFGAGLQHDSHELLRHVLDKLKKDQIKAFRVALMRKFNIPLEEGAKLSQSDPQKANMVKEWDRKLYNTTVIDDIFGGELLTTRTCLECNAVKTSCEEFLDISLPIRVVKSGGQNNNINNRFSVWNEVTTINRSLQECFKCFSEPETLSGNNKVDCEKCHEAKLNQLKAGVPIEQVFPPPEEEPEASSSNKFSNKNFVQKNKKLIQEETPQPQKQSGRKKKRRKTRKEKMAEDPFPSATEAKAEEIQEEPVAPELDKIPDEGYAEDFKESDDSTGNSGLDQKEDEEEQDEDEGEGEDEQEESEEPPPPEKKVQVPKSTKTSCRRQTMIYKPPQNLTIHLKRFTVSTRGFAQKLVDHVKFKEYIDIRDFVTSSLPSVEDHEVSQASSSSWSFEELVPKETDMLGGASGDSHDLRHHQEQADRIIEPPAIIPLKFPSLLNDNTPDSDSTLISNLESIRENLSLENSRENPIVDSLKNINSDSLQENLKNLDSELNSDFVPDNSSAPENCNLSSCKNRDSESHSDIAPENSLFNPRMNDDSKLNSMNASGNISASGDQEPESSSGVATANLNPCDDSYSNGPEITQTCVPRPPIVLEWFNTGGPLPGGEEEGSHSKDNNAPDNQLLPLAVSDNEPGPSDNGKPGAGDSKKTSDPSTLFDETAHLSNQSPPITELSTFENVDEEEPPPYPGSPILDEEAPREVIDVTLPYAEVDSGASLNWRDYKTQDIVQWSFKSEDEKPEEEEDTVCVGPITGDTFRTPLPPPLPDLWANSNPSIDPEIDTSKIAIPLSYSSPAETSNVYGPFMEEPEVDQEEVLQEQEPPFKTDPNGINYRLYGIVEHGGSLNWGHYVAYIRVNSEWYYVSDSYVSHSNISDVLARDPYILFYERVP